MDSDSVPCRAIAWIRQTDVWGGAAICCRQGRQAGAGLGATRRALAEIATAGCECITEASVGTHTPTVR